MNFNILKYITLSFALTLVLTTKAQDVSRPAFNKGIEKQGQFYFYWGWNSSVYANSDIHFKGSNYDFTLKNSVAKDRQSPFNWNTYFNPTLLTIPQFNFRMGYFIKNNLEINFGIDHMKYVFQNDQNVRMDGNINAGSQKWDGTYSDQQIIASRDLLTFEHTDGLNYVSIGVAKFFELYKSENEKLEVDALAGPDIGLMFPKTNATLFGVGADEVHFSGWGAALKTGVHIVIWKKLLLQGEVKGGYINMPDIITKGNNRDDRADQSIWFLQGNYTIGAIFPLTNKK